MDAQQLLDLALDSGPIGTYRWNLQTGELIWNRHHFLIMGLDPESTPSYALFRQHVHPDDIDALEADINRAMVSHTRHAFEFRTIWPDGSIHHAKGCGLFSYDESGKAEWLTGVLVDVTEAHATQALLEEKERVLSTLLANSPDIHARFDRQLRHLYVSPRIESITGLPYTDFIGKTSAELGMPSQLCILWESAMKETFEQKHVTSVQFEFTVPSGGLRYFESRIIPEINRAGEVDTILCITSDITQHEEMLLSLRATEQRLRKADQTKDEFLATLAHELKTPLSAIAGGIEILRHQEGVIPRPLLEAMTRQTDFICGFVDELWDVSSIVQQKATFKWEPINLSRIVHDTVDLCRVDLDEARHQLVLSFPDAPLLVYGDQRRLLQIFVNLLNNAIKYTPQGGRISIALTHDARLARVELQDNGLGIPEERLSQLFDIFFQAHHEPPQLEQGRRATDRQNEVRGLGIGLAVVKRLVEMHHGRISIQRRAEGGTSVIVCFPLLGIASRKEDVGTDRGLETSPTTNATQASANAAP